MPSLAATHGGMQSSVYPFCFAFCFLFLVYYFGPALPVKSPWCHMTKRAMNFPKPSRPWQQNSWNVTVTQFYFKLSLSLPLSPSLTYTFAYPSFLLVYIYIYKARLHHMRVLFVELVDAARICSPWYIDFGRHIREERCLIRPRNFVKTLFSPLEVIFFLHPRATLSYSMTMFRHILSRLQL